MSPRDIVDGGKFYARFSMGHVREVPDPGCEPQVWICRRLVDFPNQTVPAGGELAQCAKCCAFIVFNPARRLQAPKVCMQCERITPLPIP
jgi:hypothetical protein